ncbi:MAG: energy-coupling factor transporter transmembrane component T [Nitrososphaerota archaeon]
MSAQQIATRYRTFFSYVDARSIANRMSPITKILILLFFNAYPIIIDNPIYNALFGFFNIILMKIFKATLMHVEKYFKVLMTLALFIFVSVIFFGRSVAGPSPTVIATIGPVEVYSQALGFGVMVYVRMFALVSAMLLWLSITTTSDLMSAFEKMNISYVARTYLTMAFRFIGMFDSDFNTIQDAQKARGLDIKSQPLWRRPFVFGYYLIPLVAITIKKAIDAGVTMESRAFKAPLKIKLLEEKAMLKESYVGKYYWRYSGSDTVIIVTLVLAFIGLLVARFYGLVANPFM